MSKRVSSKKALAHASSYVMGKHLSQQSYRVCGLCHKVIRAGSGSHTLQDGVKLYSGLPVHLVCWLRQITRPMSRHWARKYWQGHGFDADRFMQ